MTVKELRELLADPDIADDVVLDGIGSVQYLASYYDGYPTEVNSSFGPIRIVDRSKLRFYQITPRDVIIEIMPAYNEDDEFDELSFKEFIFKWKEDFKKQFTYDPIKSNQLKSRILDNEKEFWSVVVDFFDYELRMFKIVQRF